MYDSKDSDQPAPVNANAYVEVLLKLRPESTTHFLMLYLSDAFYTFLAAACH